MSRFFAIAIGLGMSGAAMAETPIDPAAAQFFEAKVRPVLADHCYKCHSAAATSAGKLKGNLLLDTREGWQRGGKSGQEITPGKPEASRLIEAIKYTNPDLQMPPKDQLPASTVADLEKWVAMGAPDPRSEAAPPLKTGIDIEAGRKYWAFQPLHRYEPPAAADAAWVKTPIDRFVLAMQQSKGLKPNPATTREKLIRRAYFDLVGLPPSPADVAAFVADPAPDAYEKLIDKLLSNQHYGERWARHWLDVARFGESDGFEQDYDRPAAYQYRDFLIRAFNSDMPFNRFVQLQIAGDEIAPDDWQAMAATGFLTAGVFPTQITEKEFESTRYNQLDDMAATVGNAMLGLTVGCARCHDHKFDPIPTLDYYRLVATFGTAIRSDVPMDLTTPEQREKNRVDWQGKVADLRGKVEAIEKGEIEKKFNERIAEARQKPNASAADEWSMLTFDSIKTRDGAKLSSQTDGSLLLVGEAPRKDVYTLVAHSTLAKITSLQLEALSDKSLPHDGPGAGGNGNFALSEIEVSAAPVNGSTPAVPVKIASATATFEQNKSSLSIASSFDGRSDTGWAVDLGGIGKSQAAIFNFDKPIEFAGGVVLTIVLHFEHPSAQHLIGRPRLSVTSRLEPHFAQQKGADSAVAKIFSRLAAGESVTPADRDLARKSIASSIKEYQPLKQQLETLEKDGPAKEMATVQVTSEGLKPVKNHADERGYPHFYPTVYLLRRGDPNNKVKPITYSFPQVLTRGGKDETYWQVTPPTGAKTSYRRTALAHWLTDVDNGAGNLLARVIVNRLWQHHFGSGIVASPNDFGVQGERPINPELLDWLANDLIDHGWQLKRLQKLMMTSAVYMQDAQSSPERFAIDPHNIYLWRWQTRRLEAEPIRDSLLAVSGVLDETMYGPGTLDQNNRRRSIYFTVKRSQLIPMMMVLDWPEALNSIGSRPVTTVAPQALLFMNSPQARQYAQGFAKRIAGDSVSESIDRAYRTAFGRAPEKAETDMAQAFIEKQTQSYLDSKRPNAKDDAMADFCQALMSGNEFVYVD